eukprot:jgi/Hompol1/1340/HPOL_004684-RA
MTILTKPVQDQLNKDKVALRIENEVYIRNHPEIKEIIGYFIHKVLSTRPASITEFAVDLKQKVEAFRVMDEHAHALQAKLAGDPSE